MQPHVSRLYVISKRFTYGVYLEQPLQVADAVDLAAGEPLQQLPG